MKRYAVSLVILVVGLFWVSVGAPVWGGQGLLEPSQPSPVATPAPVDPAQLAQKDAKAKGILLESAVGKAMLAGRKEGQDYWVSISHGERPFHGQQVAWVNIVFAEPVSYEGKITTASDPCKDRIGPDERLDPDDPCLNELRDYGTAYVTFPDVRDVYATVELRRRNVVDVYTMDTPPDILADTIKYYDDPTGYAKDYESKADAFEGRPEQ